MTPLSVARRYAQALYQEAEQEGQIAQVDEDILLVRESLEQSRDLVNVFASPVISREKKEAIIKALFEKRIRPLTFRFLMLLLEKNREDSFSAVVLAYTDLRDKHLNIEGAVARSAFSLSDGEKKSVEKALADMTGKRIRLRTEIDPSLIGGIVIQVGDTVYDGSVRNQLALLRERMERNTVAST